MTEQKWHITPANLIDTLCDPEVYDLKRGRIVAHDHKTELLWGFEDCITYEMDNELREASAIIDIEVNAEDAECLKWCVPPSEIVELIWEDETTDEDALTDTVTLVSDLELVTFTVSKISATHIQLTAVYTYHTELYFEC